MQKKTIIFFLLGHTACWSWISCTVEFPHRNSESVGGPLKMPQINGAKPCIMYFMLELRLQFPGKETDVDHKGVPNWGIE